MLVDAFHQLAEQVGVENVRLSVAGYLGQRDAPYFQHVCEQIASRGLSDVFDYRGEVNREEKIAFLNSIHILSVPTPYKEPKGLSLLEAMANGVPVVQPRHGIFPEWIEKTGGGILVEPGFFRGIGGRVAADDERQRGARGDGAKRERRSASKF